MLQRQRGDSLTPFPRVSNFSPFKECVSMNMLSQGCFQQHPNLLCCLKHKPKLFPDPQPQTSPPFYFPCQDAGSPLSLLTTQGKESPGDLGPSSHNEKPMASSESSPSFTSQQRLLPSPSQKSFSLSQKSNIPSPPTALPHHVPPLPLHQRCQIFNSILSSNC